MLRLLFFVILVIVVAALIRRVLEMFSTSYTYRQGRRTKIVDSEVRSVRGQEYYRQRRQILEETRSGRISLDEAERRLDELEK